MMIIEFYCAKCKVVTNQAIRNYPSSPLHKDCGGPLEYIEVHEVENK